MKERFVPDLKFRLLWWLRSRALRWGLGFWLLKFILANNTGCG